MRPLFAALLLTLLLPAPLPAHELVTPKADHLRVSPARLRLETRYDVEAGVKSEELRGYFDYDRDGRLDGKEREKLRTYLRIAATNFIRVRIDDRDLKLELKETHASPLELPLPSGRSVQSTFALEAALPSEPKGSIRRITLGDRHKDARYPVAVSVGAEEGCRLLSGRIRAGEQSRPLLLPLPPGTPVLRGPLLRAGEVIELEVVCR